MQLYLHLTGWERERRGRVREEAGNLVMSLQGRVDNERREPSHLHTIHARPCPFTLAIPSNSAVMCALPA